MPSPYCQNDHAGHYVQERSLAETISTQSLLMPLSRSNSRSPSVKKMLYNSSPSTGNAGPLLIGLFCMKICTGAGLLALPFAFNNAGIIVGVSMTVFVAVLNCTSCNLLVLTKKIMVFGKTDPNQKKFVPRLNESSCRSISSRSPLLQTNQEDMILSQDSFAALAQYTLGKYGGPLVDSSLVVCLLGATALYLITFTQLLAEVWPDASRLLITGCALLFLFPFALMRKLSGLSHVSVVGTAVYAISLLFIFAYGWNQKQMAKSYEQIVFTWTNIQGVVLCFGTLSFSIDIPTMALMLEEEMAEPRKFSRTINITLGIVTIIYILIGLLGALEFAASAQGVAEILISDLPSSNGTADLVRLTVAVTLLCSTPLSLSPALNIVESAFERAYKAQHTHRRHNVPSIQASPSQDKIQHLAKEKEIMLPDMFSGQPLTVFQAINGSKTPPLATNDRTSANPLCISYGSIPHSPDPPTNFSVHTRKLDRNRSTSENALSMAINRSPLLVPSMPHTPVISRITSAGPLPHFENFEQPTTHGNALRLLVLLLVALLAFTIPKFAFLMSLLGCVAFSLLCYLLPPLFYIRMHRHGLTHDYFSSKSSGNHSRISARFYYILCWVYFVVGCFLSVASTMLVIIKG